MHIHNDAIIAAFLILATALTLSGCGSVGCRDSVNEELPMLVSPPSVESLQEVTVLALFDEDVFMDGRFDVRDIRVNVDDATGTTIGSLSSNTVVFDFEDASLYVDGVVLDGAVIDAATLELVLLFSSGSLSNQSVTVTVVADDGGVECDSTIRGTATLMVI